jgi:topoisomerase-4 subunit A
VRVEKWEADRVYSVAYFDEGQKYFYVKRFPAVTNGGGQQDYLDPDCRLVVITDDENPCLEVTYRGANASRPADVVDVGEYIGIKSYKAKGKRITTYDVGTLVFLEPEPGDEPEDEESADDATEEVLSNADESVNPGDVPGFPSREGGVALPSEANGRAESAELRQSSQSDGAGLGEGGHLSLQHIEIEIERTENVDDTRNPETEQLNLF